MNCDYITLCRAPRRANKLVSRQPDGSLKKDGRPYMGEFEARTVHVPTPASMGKVLEEVGGNSHMFIICGYVPGTEPQNGKQCGAPYIIMPRSQIAKTLRVSEDSSVTEGWCDLPDGRRVIARLKLNFMPSSWWLFDRDVTEGMPEALANLDLAGWRRALGNTVPGFEQAGYVLAPSTTGRVLVGGEPMEAVGWHYYVQVKDAQDLHRFGPTLLATGFTTGIGYMRPWGKYSRPWSITDPTTFSPERIVYDGAPTVDGEGLAVAPPRVTVVAGPRLDTRALADLSETNAEGVEVKTGLRLEKQRTRVKVRTPTGEVKVDRVLTPIVVDTRSLRLDTEIEVWGEARAWTLREYWARGEGKLRCQTPFRDSTSWNGILNIGSDGAPFVFDNGTRIKFELSTAEITRNHVDIWCEYLGALESSEVLARWTERLEGMNSVQRDQVRQWVHKKTGVGMGPLRAQLKDVADGWAKAKKAAVHDMARDELASEASLTGRLSVKWVDAELPVIVREVTKVLVAESKRSGVYAHSGRLSRVTRSRPATVRQVQRRNQAPERYPEMPLIQGYTRETLRDRIAASCDFYSETTVGIKRIGVPDQLVSSVMELAVPDAHPLVGIIEHPTVDHLGNVVAGDGYDPGTGYFTSMAAHIVPEMPKTITQEIAQEAYLWLINEFMAEFCFQTPEDAAGAVSCLLTGVARPMIAKLPGFVFTAPVYGTGKTALVDLISRALYGRAAPATSWSESGEEIKKALLALVMEGQPAVLYDNMPEGQSFNSNHLAAVLTSEEMRDRVLGVTGMGGGATNILFMFTGNNIAPAGDSASRFLTVVLDANTADPDRRKFSRNLKAWIEDNRAEVLRNALIIIAGFAQAADLAALLEMGAPVEDAPSRFSDWDHVARFPILWAGGADPYLCAERNKAEDEQQIAFEALAEGWHGVFGDKPMTVKAAIEHINMFGDTHPECECQNPHIKAMAFALETLVGDLSYDRQGRALGEIFSTRKNQIVGELKLLKVEREGKTRAANRWRFEKRA